jgi:hypothetical protein
MRLCWIKSATLFGQVVGADVGAVALPKNVSQPTADLINQRLEVHEKNAWMLRSLLKE